MFRESIKKMAAYVPGEQPRPGQLLIKLNTNENPYPPSPRVRRAIAKAIAGPALRLYPAPRADEFVESASRIYSIPEKMIIAGNGSASNKAGQVGGFLMQRFEIAYAYSATGAEAELTALAELLNSGTVTIGAPFRDQIGRQLALHVQVPLLHVIELGVLFDERGAQRAGRQ